MSAISTSPIAAGPDGSQQQKQQLGQLVKLVENALEPPIAEIQAALQKYFCAKAPPANTPNPTIRNKRSVELVLYACGVVVACKRHLRRDIAELDTCFLKVWPGMWRWLQFLNDQCCQKDRYGSKLSALVSMFSTLFTMSTSEALRRDVTSTPGVITMIAGYWKDQGRYPDMERMFATAQFNSPSTITLNGLLDPLHVVRTPHTTPNYLLELIATLGSAKAVATHTIENLNAVLAATPPNFQTIYAHISLISNLSSGPAPQIVLAMLDQGTIPLVVKTLLRLAKQPESWLEDETMVRKCVEVCFCTLTNAMMASNGPSWVSQSLDAGILSAILKSAPRLTRSSESDSLQCSGLLSNILCQYLVYKSVVRSAAKALRRAARLELNGGSGGPIWEAWAVFKALALERIALKESFDQSNANRDYCGRKNCRTFIGHDELLRCSGCFQTFYCNRECQRMDWSSHKLTCQELQRLLREGIHVPISSTDSGFFGEIVANEFLGNGKCLEKLATSLKASLVHSTPSEFIFSLDYTKVPVNIKVIPASELRGGDEFWDVAWNPFVEEALQSDGKLMMVKAQVQRGGRLAFTTYLVRAPIKI